MENFAVVSAFVLGLFGTIFSVAQFFYQKKTAELAAKEQAERQAERDKEQAERQAKRDKEQDKKDRLNFLKEMIIDQDISIEGRRPFYEEYISLGGNGAVVRFWNHEVEGRKRIG